MDLSAVIWVATANYVERIPEPIRSRMVDITIDRPNVQQSKIIIQSIYSELLTHNTWGHYFSKDLSEQVMDKLVGLSPRLIRIEIEKALGNAAASNRQQPIVIDVSDIKRSFKHRYQSKGIGFLASI